MGKEKNKGRLTLTLLTILCLVDVPAGASNRTYLTIQELAESTPISWEGEYRTVRNETVSVNCPIILPDAEAAPVLRVKWYPTLDPSFIAEFEPPAKAEEDTYFAYSHEYTTSFGQKYTNVLTKNENPNRYHYEQIFIPIETVDWNKVYARNSTLTALEAYKNIKNRAEEIYTKYGSCGFYPMQSAYGLSIVYLADEDGNPLRDIDAYSFFAYQTMRGLPILGNVSLNFGTTDNFKFESMYEARYYVLRIEENDAYEFAAHLFAEDKLLYDDIPLVGFYKAKPQIEKLIIDGRIRVVHNVRFGYAVYLEQDHNTEYFRLVPSWVVECDYYKSEKDETEPYIESDYTAQQHFRKLVINAQTGKLLDPENKSRDRSDSPEIITWEQIR